MPEFASYDEWRAALHTLQQEFDEFEDEFDWVSKSYAEYANEREGWEWLIARHYAIEPNYVHH